MRPATAQKFRLRRNYHSPWGGHFRKERLQSARSFYEAELGHLSRPDRKGWTRPKPGCQFHPSKSKRSFYVNLHSGAFHCFGCGASGGDIVDYVKKRDNCDFEAAAKKLGAWTDCTWEGRIQLAQAWKEAEKRRTEAAAKAEATKRERLALRDELHAVRAIYDELSARLSELRRGATPTYPGDEEHVWSLLPFALEDLRLSDRMYCAAAGVEVR